MAINQVLTQSTQLFSQVEGELILGLVIVSTLLLSTLLMNIKKTHRLDKQLKRVQQDLKVSNNSVINIGQQLLNLEKKVNKQSLPQPKKTTVAKPPIAPVTTAKPQAKTLDSELNLPKQSAVDNNESVYDKARFYLAQGDSIENIAKNCNLSHAEVSLLQALSNKPTTTL